MLPPPALTPSWCRCPVGSDFWFMGLRCDYRVTQQSLLGMAAGVLLSILLLGAVIAAVAVRRFKVLLMEARADQTRSRWDERDGVRDGAAAAGLMLRSLSGVLGAMGSSSSLTRGQREPQLGGMQGCRVGSG